MESFKYLEKEGNNYILKSQKTLSIILGGGCIILGAFICIRGMSDKSSLFIGILIMMFSVLIFMRMNAKIIFNPVDRTIIFPKLKNKDGLVLSFDQFSNFKMVYLKQYGIATNKWLQMEFDINGKIKAMQIRQYGPSAKNAQYLIEEIEQVMGINGHENDLQ